MAHLYPKPPIVRGATGLDQLIAGRDAALRLQPLLQFALWIELRQGTLERRLRDRSAKGAGRVEPSLQEHGRNQRLYRVGEYVRGVAQPGCFGAAPETQRFRELVVTRPARQSLGAHELRAEPGQHAFVRVRLTHEQQLSHAKAQHRVAQKLESLVVGECALLVREARVGQSLFEPRGSRLEADQGRHPLALFREIGAHAGRDHSIGARNGCYNAPRQSRVTRETSDERACQLRDVSLGYSDLMAALKACPFCRKLYTRSEGSTCPDCDVALVAMDELPPSLDALSDEAEVGAITFPENQPLPTTYMGRGRGALLIIAALGLFAFFLPWVELVTPESVVYSAFDLARGRAGFLWGGAAAWMVLIPLVVTRRTIAAMRGVRIVVAMFAAMTLTETLMLGLMPPQRGATPLELHFRYGLFVSAAISVVGAIVGARFGGSLDNLPKFLLDTRQAAPTTDASARETSAGKTLH